MNFATTKEKIIQFIDFKQISTTNFFKETGIKRGFLDSDKLKASVSDIFIAKIFAKYPEINLEWLITGEGKMLKTSDFDQENESKIITMVHNNTIKTHESLIQEIENLKKTIQIIEDERDFLREIIKPQAIEKSEST